MPRSIKPQRVNHMNAVLQDFDASVAHFEQAYGAEFMVDMPQKEFHACLFEMGQAIFELFVPWDFLVSARLGPHHVGLEWQADMDEVRAAVADHGIRTVRDIGIALHTHPDDCFGVAHEFYAGEFHSRDWPLLGGRIKSPEYWASEHPLGLTGLRGYTHVVDDIAAASAFYQGFLGAEPLFEEARPAIGGRAAGLKVADVVVELLMPTGPTAAARASPPGPGHPLDGLRPSRYRPGPRLLRGAGNSDRARNRRGLSRRTRGSEPRDHVRVRGMSGPIRRTSETITGLSAPGAWGRAQRGPWATGPAWPARARRRPVLRAGSPSTR